MTPHQKIDEMIKNAGFQDSVNDQLRIAKHYMTKHRSQWVDDLWEIYGKDVVIDD